VTGVTRLGKSVSGARGAPLPPAARKGRIRLSRRSPSYFPATPRPRRRTGAKQLGFRGPRPHMRPMTQPTTLERAFILARSGSCASVQDIRATLKRERFDQVEAHLAGPSLARQLRGLCDAARSDRTA
jgi:hypothetical protein